MLQGRKKISKSIILIGLILIVVGVGLLIVNTMIKKDDIRSVKAKLMCDTEYFTDCNQVQKLNGYVVTLKHALYSELTKNGCCIFEVYKENGKMEVPEFFNGNQIRTFGEGDNRLSICLNATGTIKHKAEMKDDKLIIYTEFKVGTMDPAGVEDYKENQLYLFSGKTKELQIDCMKGTYGFKLVDNIKGKEFKVADNMNLSLSYLGATITTDKKLDSFKIEIVTTKGEKETLFDLKSEEDVEGMLSEGYYEDAGEKGYVYSYNFQKPYDICKIKKIYVDDKEIK